MLVATSSPCKAVGHGKGMWGATGGLLKKKMAFAGFVLPSAAPPLLPFFHGADSNAPLAASVEATDLQDVSTCGCE